MFQNSVISKTGQMWKLYAGIAAMVIGSIVPAFEQSGMSWTAGTILAVGGYAFVLAFISCPACSQHWFYRALLYVEMYGPLFREAECPSCEKNFG